MKRVKTYSDFRIDDLGERDVNLIELISEFLLDCFSKYSPLWLPDHDAFVKEIHKAFTRGRSRVLLDKDNHPIGWI